MFYNGHIMTLLRRLNLQDGQGLTWVGALVIWTLFWMAFAVSVVFVEGMARDEIEVYNKNHP